VPRLRPVETTRPASAATLFECLVLLLLLLALVLLLLWLLLLWLLLVGFLLLLLVLLGVLPVQKPALVAVLAVARL
jgi:hypothetical protein